MDNTNDNNTIHHHPYRHPRQAHRTNSVSSTRSRDSSAHSHHSHHSEAGDYEDAPENLDQLFASVNVHDRNLNVTSPLTPYLNAVIGNDEMMSGNQVHPQYQQMQTVGQPMGSGFEQIHQLPLDSNPLTVSGWFNENDIFTKTLTDDQGPTDYNIDPFAPIGEENGGFVNNEPQQSTTAVTDPFSVPWEQQGTLPPMQETPGYSGYQQPVQPENGYHTENPYTGMSRCTSASSLHSGYSDASYQSNQSNVSQRGRPPKYCTDGLPTDASEQERKKLERDRNNHAVKASRDKKKSEQIRMMEAVTLVLQNRTIVEQNYANSPIALNALAETFNGFTAEHQRILEETLAKLLAPPRQRNNQKRRKSEDEG